MTRLDQTPIAFDPLDEAYALAPPTVDGASLRENFPSAAQAGDTIPQSEIPLSEIPLGSEPLPTLGRSRPSLPRVGHDDRSRPDPAHFNDPARFTLRNLLFVITMASVVLAIGVRFPRSHFAGAAGLAALLTAVSASWLRNSGAIWQLAWWTLLGIYLMACGFALMGM
jgi:hypothetical protein